MLIVPVIKSSKVIIHVFFWSTFDCFPTHLCMKWCSRYFRLCMCLFKDATAILGM